MESVLVVISLLSTLCHVFAVQPKEVCLLQLDEGPCKGDVQRFYYNTITQKCEDFSYGGCAGNANNFITFQECQKTCWKIPKIPQICRFQKEEGPCRALLQRYHFNMTTMQCQPFNYGGCQGNNNRFDDAQSCMEYCRPRKTTSVLCLGPLDVGPCSASIPRYHYSSLTKTCEQFLYSGCGGSSNNFVSRQSCLDVCVLRGQPRKTRPFGRRSLRKKNMNNVRVFSV
ncbi:tissue factor pathway inhibitor 2 [Osmerus eperlanus]|uniref:tissue factor pathway inhibitor 2 n=1 Tax=Osmerus eperlanus TaxID=29151 RepID=UPI002E1080FC